MRALPLKSKRRNMTLELQEEKKPVVAFRKNRECNGARPKLAFDGA